MTLMTVLVSLTHTKALVYLDDYHSITTLTAQTKRLHLWREQNIGVNFDFHRKTNAVKASSYKWSVHLLHKKRLSSLFISLLTLTNLELKFVYFS